MHFGTARMTPCSPPVAATPRAEPDDLFAKGIRPLLLSSPLVLSFGPSGKREAPGADLGPGDVPPPQVAGEQLGAPEGAVGRVAEHVRLGVVDQDFDAPARVGAADPRRL